ncbi:MafI family immunity protein [Erwinia sp. P6884]|uniref:MafI family immunity protein n=1 Tax=Erwinia sp. P6884 TaxID=3141450 RepID=UPI00318E4856
MFGNRITQLGKNLEDRLEPSLIEGALDYIQYNEEPLAFEILCDHISEYDTAITSDEYEKIANLAKEMNLDINEAPFKYLKQLVV